MELHTLVLFKDGESVLKDLDAKRLYQCEILNKSIKKTKRGSDMSVVFKYPEIDMTEIRYYFCEPTLDYLYKTIAGMNFTGLNFLDGTWDADIINYCLGRIRG